MLSLLILDSVDPSTNLTCNQNATFAACLKDPSALQVMYEYLKSEMECGVVY